MTQPAAVPRARLRALAYRTFYRLPARWKRRIVRTFQPTYTVGAVTLVRAEPTAVPAPPELPPAVPAPPERPTAVPAPPERPTAVPAPPERLLLLRQPPGAGWSLPGGLLDRHEQPVECAARELAEETGIRVPPERLRPATPNALVHTDGQWIDLVFETEVPATQALTIDGAEVLEAAWHRLDALPPLTVPTARLLAHYGIGPYAEYPEVLR